jgi:hypothetical protein
MRVPLRVALTIKRQEFDFSALRPSVSGRGHQLNEPQQNAKVRFQLTQSIWARATEVRNGV